MDLYGVKKNMFCHLMILPLAQPCPIPPSDKRSKALVYLAMDRCDPDMNMST